MKKIVLRCRGIIVDDGELLVVRHPQSDFFALPGGGMERGEDVKECMERELIEELGIKPDIGRLLYINNYSHHDGERHSVEFLFEILNSKDYRNIDGLDRTHQHEIEEIRWAKPGEEINILPKGLREDLQANVIFSDQIRYLN